MDRARLDWDAGNLEKCQKHGVTLEEIDAAFAAGAQALPGHSQTRGPLYWSSIFAIFTIRWFEARYLHAKEAKRHEQAR